MLTVTIEYRAAIIMQYALPINPFAIKSGFAMNVTVSDFVNVGEQAIALGYPAPEKIALLPENFATAKTITDLRQRSEADTVQKLLRMGGVPTDDRKSFKVPYIQNNGFDWVSPIIFIGAGIISNNPNYVSISLNIISSFIYDFLKGSSKKKVVKLNIVIEKQNDRKYKMITYEGDIDGISSLAKIIQETSYD